jgi:hypothetical protein
MRRAGTSWSWRSCWSWLTGGVSRPRTSVYPPLFQVQPRVGRRRRRGRLLPVLIFVGRGLCV